MNAVPLRRRLWYRLTLLALALYGLLLAGLLIGETRIALPGSVFPHAWRAAPPGTQELRLHSSSGEEIVAWWLPPPGWTPADGALIYCHGSGENLSDCGRNLVAWR